MRFLGMMEKREVIIKNKTGLHARPAAVFVQIANKYDSEISITKDNQKVNGKSIMGILMLAAEKGAKVIITAEGDDAKEAIEELSGMLLRDEETGF